MEAFSTDETGGVVQVRKIKTAMLLVLAVSGLASLGSGTALADGRDGRSFDHGGFVKGDGAEANGGSAAGTLSQQNIAQESRQNSNCANPNEVTFVVSGRVEGRCFEKDASFNKHARFKGGGAEANGGSAVADAFQQNIAQEGRQNNNCANPNGSSLEATGGRAEVDCVTVDRSDNVHTTEIGRGAEADGGSSAVDLFQQNVAQEGRQNNNCGNPNNVTVTASGSRSRTQCLAFDDSKNIGSLYR